MSTDNFQNLPKNGIPWEWSWIFCGFFWKFRICWVALGSTPVVYFILGGGLKSLSISGPGSSFKLMMRQDFWRPPPTLSCLLHLFCFAEFWLNRKKKYNLLKRIYCRNGIECTWKRNTEEYRLEDCWRLPEVLIQLRETLGGFWKDKKKFEGFFLRFRKDV